LTGAGAFDQAETQTHPGIVNAAYAFDVAWASGKYFRSANLFPIAISGRSK
jgi:hypothetical protein